MVTIDKPYRSELSETQRAYIYGLYEAGLSHRTIAARTGVPKGTVTRTIKNIARNLAAAAGAGGVQQNESNPFKSKPRSGRPRRNDGARRKVVGAVGRVGAGAGVTKGEKGEKGKTKKGS